MKRVTLYQALRNCERWEDRRGIIKSQFYHIPLMRFKNRIYDGWAVLVGACNKSTWTGLPPTGYAGGYSHWRCGRARGHQGSHRFINYVWSGKPDQKVYFDPLPTRNPDGSRYDTRTMAPFRKVTSKRHAVERRGRSKRLAELHYQLLAEGQRRARVQANRSGKETGLGWSALTKDGE